MFLLRCIFWLSVVYASMSFGGGALRHRGSFDAAVASTSPTLDSVATQAVGGVSALCRGREAQCLQDAARMTSLVRATLLQDDDKSIVQEAPEPPLPPPAPRRRVAAAMLTRSH